MALKYKFDDYAEKEINGIKAISEAGTFKSKTGRTTRQWKLVCHCGEEFNTDSARYARGMITGCGCTCTHSKRYKKISDEKAGFNKLLLSYRSNAKNRGYSFDLSIDEFRTITKQSCIYCGDRPLLLRLGDKRTEGPYVYNGVDRWNNLIGYTTENAVPCCTSCNMMKGTMSGAEFIDHINKIKNNLHLKEED